MLRYVKKILQTWQFLKIKKLNICKVSLIIRLHWKGRHIMAPNYAIGAMGGYDPYLYEALKTQNYGYAYNPSFTGVQKSSGGDSTPVPTTVSKPAEQSGSGVGKALTVGATLSAAAYIAGAVKGKGWKPSEAWKGLKMLWNGSVGKYFAKQEPLQMFKTANGEWVCCVPSNKYGQIIQVAENNASAGILQRLGISTEIAKLGEKGTSLHDVEFVHKGNKFRFRDGKLHSYTNSNGEDLLNKFNNPTEKGDIEYKKQIMEVYNKLAKGETPNEVTVNNLLYAFRDNAGLRHCRMTSDGPVLERIYTNRFTPDSERILAIRHDNSTISDCMKQLMEAEEGKLPDGIRISEDFIPYENNASLWIKDGEYAGIRIGNNNYGLETEKYKAYIERLGKDLPTIQDLIKENKLANPFYSL